MEPNDPLAGDIGAAFALGVNVGTAISTAKARAAISVFMIRLHVYDGCSVISVRTGITRRVQERTWVYRHAGAVMGITFSEHFSVIQI